MNPKSVINNSSMFVFILQNNLKYVWDLPPAFNQRFLETILELI